jgi:type IV pilus assembly protein PilA
MKKTNRKGFTLIELMIVVAIIGILAAIAIPNFIRYQLRSKTTEAKVVLGGVKTSEESFRAEYDNYAALAANPAAASAGTKQNWVMADCAAGCRRTNVAACVQFACIGYEPSGQVYYQYATATRVAGANTVAEFSAGATADLDGDTQIGGFSLRTANAPALAGASNIADPLTTMPGSNCGANTIPAGEVFDCRPNVY